MPDAVQVLHQCEPANIFDNSGLGEPRIDTKGQWTDRGLGLAGARDDPSVRKPVLVKEIGDELAFDPGLPT